jgi:predicted TIM-barrel fold metal-dependent hydrolase
MSIFDEPKIDCHNHVFDPARFPYQEGNFYHPAGQEIGAPAQLLNVFDAYGVKHALVVEPNSGYGNDNRCLLDTLSRNRERLKGIAVVDVGASRDELADLQAQGIVGAAFNPALFGVDAYAGSGSLLERIGELDLFAQIQVKGDQLPAMRPMLESSGVRLLFDHCGLPDISAGLGQPGFASLLEIGHRGKAWVKLSGLMKFSREPYPYTDTWPFVRALFDAFGVRRCLWGSDWPFLRAPGRIDYGPLLTLFARLFPEESTRRQILWENPVALFGFTKTGN